MTTRCKVYVESVKLYGHNGQITQEEVQMRAVTGKNTKDGMDEDNTYAKYTPSADFRMSVTNPALFGQFRPSQTYYIDMTPAED